MEERANTIFAVKWSSYRRLETLVLKWLAHVYKGLTFYVVDYLKKAGKIWLRLVYGSSSEKIFDFWKCQMFVNKRFKNTSNAAIQLVKNSKLFEPSQRRTKLTAKWPINMSRHFRMSDLSVVEALITYCEILCHWLTFKSLSEAFI